MEMFSLFREQLLFIKALKHRKVSEKEHTGKRSCRISKGFFIIGYHNGIRLSKRKVYHCLAYGHIKSYSFRYRVTNFLKYTLELSRHITPMPFLEKPELAPVV